MKANEPIQMKKGRGGRRPGAGRPKGTGKYGCRTKTVRIPIDMIPEIDTFIRERIKDPAVTSLLEQACELAKYAASIRWDGRRNTKDWLTGLHELIAKFQNDYEQYTNK